MDEARRLMARLERIEELRANAAAPAALLDELRGLLRDGEAWALAEGVSAARARRALEGLDAALAGCDLPPGTEPSGSSDRKEVSRGAVPHR
jgi:hypothetical protein